MEVDWIIAIVDPANLNCVFMFTLMFMFMFMFHQVFLKYWLFFSFLFLVGCGH